MVELLSNIETKILGEIYSSTEAMKNTITLCDDFGGRLAGTEDNKGAAKLLLDKFEEYGFSDPYLESFSFQGCEVGISELEIIEPVRKKVSCVTLPMTIEDEIEGDVVYVGQCENLSQKLDKLDGKIVLTSLKITIHEPILRCIAAGAIGVIWMHPFPMKGAIVGVPPSIVPAVGISYEAGSMINRYLKRGHPRLRMKTNCTHLKKDSWNICGEIKGNGTSDEFIMFGGHYDGHEIAQAAFDCGAPSMASLEIGRILNEFSDNLDRNIKVVLFSAEEFGCWGSKAYVKSHRKELERMRFTYQLDSCAAGSIQTLTIDYWPELEPFFEKVRDDMAIDMPIKQCLGPGDSRAFFNMGIPTGCVREVKRWDNPGALENLTTVWHTGFDTVDKINIRSLREVVAIGAISGFRICNKKEWPKHRTLDEINNLPIMKRYLK